MADQLELDVWLALYEMKFLVLSDEGGADLYYGDRHDATTKNQLDVVAHDDAVALVVECKSSEAGNRREDFDALLSKLAKNRDHVRTYLNQDPSREKKLKVGAIFVVDGVTLSRADLDRAKNDKILVLDRRAISYYITLAKRIKEAAKYQLFAEVFEGQTVDDLKLIVPAVQAKMGERRVYHFAMTPASLLKIAFVAHRAESDVETYQRLVEPKRLESIREYINQKGVFPTSIVVNFVQETSASGRHKDLVFNPFEKGESTEDSRVGLLTLPRLYHSAWIIDGQHRLLAYAGHHWASTATLAVTAFEGLDADKQADLFVQINSEQKKVPASHLEALVATIRWRSKDEQQQVRAIISRMAQELRKDPQSPLYARILLPDEEKTPVRCVTLSTMAEALKRRGFFIESEIKGKARGYGPLWAFDPAETLKRTKSIINSLFGEIRYHNQELWESGSPTGGLVATNLGVGACLRVLLEILKTLKSEIPRFDGKSTDELNALLLPYARAIGEYLATLTEEETKAICAGRYGAGGPIVPSYYIGQAIREAGLSLDYKELDQWLLDQSVSRDGGVLQKLNDVVHRVKEVVVAQMVDAHGEEGWWWEVPLDVRQEVSPRHEADKGVRPKEEYLNLADYRKIVLAHWKLFANILGFPAQGSKDARTHWLVVLSDIHKQAVQTGGPRLKAEDRTELDRIDDFLKLKGV